jgi:hypothetical protein
VIILSHECHHDEDECEKCHHNEFERFAFFVLPSNTSGSVSIPLSTGPTTLATLTIHTDPDDVVSLTGTVGWRVIANGTGLTRANVLFQFMRHAVVGGPVIFSADDSGESGFDLNKVTSFSHVDTGFTDFDDSGFTKRRTTYFLTAQLLDPGSAATVIGPITFTATEIERRHHHDDD